MINGTVGRVRGAGGSEETVADSGRRPQVETSVRDVEAQAGDRLHFAHQPTRLSSPTKQKYLHKTREEENVVSVDEGERACEAS